MSAARRGSAAGRGALALVLELGLLGAPGSAGAQSAPPPAGAEVSAPAPAPQEAAGESSGHQLSAYVTSGGMAYLSNARTIGGIGGGVGIRDILDQRFLFQADLNYLTLIGNVAALRVGAGVQRKGTYTPAVLLTLSALLGDSLTFLTPQHFSAVTGPAVALGIVIAPLRFTFDRTQVSLLQLGVGLGTDLPGLGRSFSVGALEIGSSF